MRFKILAVLFVLAGCLAVSFGWSWWRQWRDDREGRLRPIAPGIIEKMEAGMERYERQHRD